ncbi:hypothetical protein [uncultured Tenacibaculum sp.]|uniref:hypothetical protein n=1 Tax=uncultured Tenacibaculum sp. TaxID=174713 RepID=UPI002601B75B|nr:hypothetical protein [uncultured Tenacibaculum sp.]
MKKIVLLSMCALLSITLQAQKSFFKALEANGENAIYEGFTEISPNGGGTCNFGRSLPKVKVNIVRIANGIPVGFVGKPVAKDWGEIGETELSDYGRMDSYPLTMSMKHTRTKEGYVVIDDIIFVLDKISDNNLPSVNDITKIYALVKNGKTTTKKKKKKGGFLARMKNKLNSAGLSPTHKYLKSVNLVEKFTNYVKAMQAKQAAYTLTAKDKNDTAKIKAARNAGDAEIKRYNDSIKATPEYKDLQRRIKQNEQNYQDAKAQNTVTLRNNTGSTIYIGKSGSRNQGTRIDSGSTATWSCDSNAYLQVKTKSGGSNNYSTTNTKVYSANSGCGSIIAIN